MRSIPTSAGSACGKRRRARQQGGPGQALRTLWHWISGTGYRPERHYMRGKAAGGEAGR
jgi:hypothetical protein